MHEYEDGDDYDATMDDINESKPGSHSEKDSVDRIIFDEEAEYLEEAWKEWMGLMVDDGKP